MTRHARPLAALTGACSAAFATVLRLALSAAVVVIGSLILLHSGHKERRTCP